jgi:hypothetical protein
MKKDASQVTQAERQEAKRRIEGSLAPDAPDQSDAGHHLSMGMKMH